MKRDPPEGCDAEPEGQDMFHWTGTIMGPPNTPYEEGIFFVDITFPPDYPKREYIIRISLPGEQSASSPYAASGIVLKQLAYPDTSGSHFPVIEILRQYLNDRAQYENTAREWTRHYAT